MCALQPSHPDITLVQSTILRAYQLPSSLEHLPQLARDSETELVGCWCSLPEGMERVTEGTPEIPTSLPEPVALALGGGGLRGY